jgi:hypothetical protein
MREALRDIPPTSFACLVLVDALVRQGDEAVAVVEYSPDLDVRLIRNIWARKGVLERVHDGS